MTSRQKRRLRQQLAERIDEERRGAPIPGEIAARMTKPKPSTLLYQVMVERRADGAPLAVGPAWSEDAAGRFAEAIRDMIIIGRERDWANPVVVPVFAGMRQRISGADLAA